MNIASKIFQYNSVYEFHSDRTGITLQITDSYHVRNEMLGQMKRNANTWFELALGRAPMELQSTLQVCCMHVGLRYTQPTWQKYLSVNQSLSGINSAELGASLAEQYGKAIGPVHRELCTPDGPCSLALSHVYV
jgi:phosphatidylinositol 4-kinase